MKKTAVVFGTTTGNTEKAAHLIAEAIGKDKVSLMNVSSFSAADISGFDFLIFGTSTWGYGDIQDDWETFLPSLKKSDLSGKTIALFGLGDSASYNETFCDGIGILYEVLQDTGASFTGFCETSGYNFSSSKAVVNGKFAGLPLDEDNEAGKTRERISEWVDSFSNNPEIKA